MIRCALLLAAVASLLAVTPAGAATVTWTPGYSDPPGTPPEESCSRYAACPPPSLSITDSGAERNELSVESTGSTIVVRDTATPLQTSAPCTQQPDGSVTCPAGAFVTVNAGGGDDRVVSPGGVVHGGAGDDDLTAPSTSGNEGNDTLRPLDIGQQLNGGPGTDVVEGGLGDDAITDDELAPQADRLDGGAGNDRISFERRPVAVRVDLGVVPQQAGTTGEANVVGGFELASGGAGNDELLGPLGGSTSLDGGDGDDRLVARAGDEVTLRGDAGSDEIVGVPGASGRYFGGAGDDVISGGAGDDDIYGDSGGDRIEGGAGADSIEGEAGADEIVGGAGGDVAAGGSGADVMSGGVGNDRMWGGTGADRLDGGAGGDRLIGDSGRDLIMGGSGGDRIFARDRQRRDAVRCGTGRDVASVDRRERATACERVSRPKRRRARS